MLLGDGEYTVAEVAELSGFSSENYFCRLYKKLVGKTPTNNLDNKANAQNRMVKNIRF